MEAKPWVRAVIGALFVTSIGVGALIACSSDSDTSSASSDAGSTSDVTTSAPEDAATADVVTDAGPTAPAQCNVIGVEFGQISIGKPACNDCVRRKCCDFAYACTESPPDASTLFTADGSLGECSQRFTCYTNNCIGVPDVEACQATCDTQFSASANTRGRALIGCLFGATPGTPTDGENCSKDPASGSALCTP